MMGPRGFAGDMCGPFFYFFPGVDSGHFLFRVPLLHCMMQSFALSTSHHLTPSPHRRRYYVSGSMDRGITAIDGIGNACVHTSRSIAYLYKIIYIFLFVSDTAWIGASHTNALSSTNESHPCDTLIGIVDYNEAGRMHRRHAINTTGDQQHVCSNAARISKRRPSLLREHGTAW